MVAPGNGRGRREISASHRICDQESETHRRREFRREGQTVAEVVHQGTFRPRPYRSSDRVSGTDNDDIEGLLRLVGFSYEPMLAATLPRLMILRDVGIPPRQLWVPDLNARATLTHIKYVAMAVRDQQDYSKLDTQFALLEVSALAAPFLLSEAVLATAVIAATDTSFFGIAMAGQVPDYLPQEADIHFALGASLILGTQRLSELELRMTQ